MTDQSSGAVNAPRPVPGTDDPLSFPEVRHWFLGQWDPDNAAYYNPLAIRIRGDLDREALQATLDEVTRRHESLRTTFPMVGGVPFRAVADPAPVTIEVEDLSGLSVDKRERLVTERVTECAASRYDLEKGPLFRVRLFLLGPTDHVLLVSAHHIIADGWSVGVVLQEIEALYAAFHAGATPALEPTAMQYREFARQQVEEMSDEAVERDQLYWKAQLDGVPSLDLPTDRPRTAAGAREGGTTFFDIPAELYQGLAALARSARATPFMAFLALYDALLARLTGQDDFAVGSPVAGRPRRELQSVIGCFVNMLVLRADVSGDPTFRQLLDRTRATVVGAFAHQGLAFEKLVFELQPDRDPTRFPLFQAVLTMQPGILQFPALADLEVEDFPFEHRMTIVDITLTLEIVDDGVRGIVAYDSGLFTRATIDRFIERFLALLEAVVADPDAPVSTHADIAAESRRGGWLRRRPTEARP